jgi:hypothetical protein
MDLGDQGIISQFGQNENSTILCMLKRLLKWSHLSAKSLHHLVSMDLLGRLSCLDFFDELLLVSQTPSRQAVLDILGQSILPVGSGPDLQRRFCTGRSGA